MRIPKDSQMTRLQKMFYAANCGGYESQPYGKQEILDIRRRERSLTLDAIWQRLSFVSSAF